MPQTFSLVGVKNKNEFMKYKQHSKGLANSYLINFEMEKFKLGSLDSMLLNLEKAKKIEVNVENYMKRVEKAYQDLIPDKKLIDNTLDTTVGQKKLEKYLTQFEWDEGKFPRSASLFDQVNQLEYKLSEMDKRFKILQQNYHDSKTLISSTQDKKTTFSSLINNDLNEVIFDLVDKKDITIPLDMFVQNSSYLQSYIVFIPENNLEDFQKQYEYSKVDYIMPGSYKELCNVYNHVVAHIVALKLSEDQLIQVLKKDFNTVVRKYDYDPEQAKISSKEKNKILNQNKTDKEILEGACKENFKEAITLGIHLKFYIVIIDSCLRFGGMDHFTIIVNFFEPGKKQRLIKKLISVYAEQDKLDFYGTKEQINDTEDFFPFVWTDIYVRFQIIYMKIVFFLIQLKFYCQAFLNKIILNLRIFQSVFNFILRKINFIQFIFFLTNFLQKFQTFIFNFIFLQIYFLYIRMIYQAFQQFFKTIQ